MIRERAAQRDRCLRVEPLGNDRFTFSASLTDRSYGGDHEPPIGVATIHDFAVTGEVVGEQLYLDRLEVEAITHPYQRCPFILPVCDQLIGSHIGVGWRATVLELLGGARGCTHVTSLLLSLTEMTTLTYFLRINEILPYGESRRADGSWIATGIDITSSLSGACHVLNKREGDGGVDS